MMAAFRPRVGEIQVKSGNADGWQNLMKDGEYFGADQADISKAVVRGARIDFLQAEGHAFDANKGGIGIAVCPGEQKPAASAPQIHFDRFTLVKERLKCSGKRIGIGRENIFIRKFAAGSSLSHHELCGV